MEPPFLAIELRKILLWLTLEENSFENRSIGLVGLVVCLKNDRKWAWFCPKVGVASKISCALHNPPFRHPGSATANTVDTVIPQYFLHNVLSATISNTAHYSTTTIPYACTLQQKLLFLLRIQLVYLRKMSN